MTDPLGFTCMVLLDEPSEVIASALKHAFGYAAPRSSIEIEDAFSANADQALRVSVDGHEIICAVFSHAMPEDEYDFAVDNSIFWLEAADRLYEHRAFVVMTAPERQTVHGLARAQAIAMTRLAAAMCEVMPACGVYWDSAGVMAKPEAVVRASNNIARDKWPVDLWIGWTVYAKRNTNMRVLALRSRGAAPFLGFELRIPPFEATDDKEPMRLLMIATGHLLAHGSVIKDGQRVDITGERPMSYQLRMGTADEPGLAELTVIGAEPETMG